MHTSPNVLLAVNFSPKNAPSCNLSYIVARRFGKFRVIVNIADNRKAVAVGAQVIQKLHGVNGKIPSAATLNPS